MEALYFGPGKGERSESAVSRDGSVRLGWSQGLNLLETTQSSMPTSLLYNAIGKRFGSQIALDSLSLAVEPGEIFGFLGANGAGKTTAIHLAMGFLRPTTGEGQLLGMPFSNARAARARMGYVPDAPSFFARTALDCVLLAARLNHDKPRARGDELRERAMELLRRFELPAQGQLATRFSRGMQQRLALVQALVTRPALLILDEPTSALDPPAVMLVREALRAARDEGCAVFFSSHQLQEVELLCDRAAFLQEGKVLRQGPLAMLLREGQRSRITLRGLAWDHPFTLRHTEQREAAAQGNASTGQAQQSGEGHLDRTFLMPVEQQQAFVEGAWLAGAELVAVARERQTLEQLFQQPGLRQGEPVSAQAQTARADEADAHADINAGEADA
jgi:ABC-2 type transport system ATP-binding protein